ncbi:hypothetical protein Pelo_282 [Pelomyxa schiedti]|nr:hypothetical protein Pelo_282 [Pelomyxa schiedti]
MLLTTTTLSVVDWWAIGVGIGGTWGYTVATHEALAIESISLLVTSTPGMLEIAQHSAEVTLGAKEEDCFVLNATSSESTCPSPHWSELNDYICGINRPLNHFHHPWSGSGMNAERILGRRDISCLSAINWARDDRVKNPFSSSSQEGNGLTWTGALLAYGYTPEEKQAAYRRLGHTQHLLADLGQPEHTHLEPHVVRQGFEQWIEEKIFHETGFLKSLLSKQSLQVKSVVLDLEEHLQSLAFLTYNLSSFWGGKLKEDNKEPVLETELRSAFRVTFESGFFRLNERWFLFNYPNMSSPSDTSVGVLKADDYNQKERPVAIGSNSQAFWETSAEAVQAPNGYFYLRNLIEAVPANFKGLTNVEGTSLASLFSQFLLPEIINYSAGLLKFFWEIVNPPPYVRSLSMLNGTICALHEEWVDITKRVKRTNYADSPLPTVIHRLRVIGGECFQEGTETENQLSLRVEFAGGRISASSVVVTLNDETMEGRLHGQTWIGALTGSSEPHSGLTIKVYAADTNTHRQLRNYAGGILDSDPSTPARLCDGLPPYNWCDYTPGPYTTTPGSTSA